MTIWKQHQANLRKRLKEDDLSNFLGWSEIRATMYVGNGAAYIQGEYEVLKTEWARWMTVVRWTGFGGDSFHSGDGYASSPNLIHQAYHLKQWLDRTRQDIKEMQSIVEVGAGYGAMALICRRLGFEGRYYIVDLPELAQIQVYYLDLTSPQHRSMTYWTIALKACDLFIASHSLSEMPLTEREKLLSQVEAKEYLFTSSYEFEGVDNQRWFKELAGSIMGTDWKFYPHPHQENAFYLVGIEL